MSQPVADRNLLFGILAMQMDFINREQLVAAMQAWVFDKQKPLGEILCAQKALAEDSRVMIDGIVQQHLAQHGNDAEKSLAAVAGGAEIRQELQSITAVGGQAPVAPPVTELDPYATVAPQGPSRTGLADEKPTALPAGLLPAGAMRFRLVRPHAKGGLGEVFVALDEELHREVALKEIQDRQADNLESRTRFMLEAEITGGLEHPGIVPVYGLGAYPDGRPYYAMRFIRGDSLKDAIDRFHQTSRDRKEAAGERTLELRSLLGRFVDVCNAIAYAHSRDILHRDLKPANIMLGKFGETLVVDWGLAKPIDQPERAATSTVPGEGSLMPASMTAASKTMMGNAVGTPQYMSPEQAAGQLDQLGPASDVYSLGATLYCILTGQPPVTEGDLGTVLRRVQSGDFPSPRAVNADVDPALEAVCLKAMKLKAGERYPAARLLADDIEHWLADEPVSAWTEPWTKRTRRWIGRHATLVTGVASAVAVALVGLILTTVLLTAANERERAAKRLAQEQKAIAEVNFQLARAAVDRYHTKVSEDDLLHEPGMQPLRKKLLEDAEEFYQKFLAKHQGDPRLQGELGKATFRLGQITGDIGSERDAIKLLEQAAQLFETVPKDKASVDFTSDQAACYHHLGRLYRISNQIAASDQDYAKALTLWQRLVTDQPQEERYQAGLARTQMGIGNARRTDSRLPEAQTSYEKSLNGWQTLADAHPATLQYQRDLGVNQSNLGEVIEALGGDAKDAQAHLRAAETIQKKLTADWPNIRKFQDDFAATNYLLGKSLFNSSDNRADAEPFFRAADKLLLNLTLVHPAVTSYHARLAVTKLALANLYRGEGDVTKAETFCKEALAMQRQLIDKHKGPAAYESELARGLYTLGEIFAADPQGARSKEAEATLSEAAQIQDKLAKAQMDYPLHQRDLAKTFTALGLLYAKRNRDDKATEAYQKAAAVWENLVKKHPGDPEDAIGQAKTFFCLGDLNKIAGKPKEAEPWYTRAVDCFDVKNAQVLASARLKTSLSNAYWARADTRTKLGQHDAALLDWDSALEFARPIDKFSIRLPRAAALARAGRHVEAVKEAQEMVGKNEEVKHKCAEVGKPYPAYGGTAYRLGRVYALAALAAKDSKEKADEYAVEALQLLGKANDAGYFKSLREQTQLKTDPALQVLRDRPEFRKLSSALKLQ